MRVLVSLLSLAAVGVAVWTFMRASLGPVDGFDLPPTAIDRVAVGTMAPDFRLDSYSGDVVSLSDYRGDKDVVLVFYRGHW